MRVSRSKIIGSLLLFFGAAVLVGSCGWPNWDEHRGWNACAANSDCTLAANTCCGVCGKPELDDVDAVNRDRIDRHFSDVCPNPISCPKCATIVNPDLLAICSFSRCRAIDIRDQALSECTQDSDCRLRVAGCCECGGSTAPWDLIAINVARERDYQKLSCDAGQACPECAPIYPATVEAYCPSNRHCDIRYAIGSQ